MVIFETEKTFVWFRLNESEDDLSDNDWPVITLAILGWKLLMPDISIFDHIFGHIDGSSASYDFSKPYSESGEKTESDEDKISISNIFSWNGLHPIWTSKVR